MTSNFTKAVVHHAEDMFAWRVPNADNQMHWVADLNVPTWGFIDEILEDVYKRTNNINGRWIDNDGIISYKKPLEVHLGVSKRRPTIVRKNKGSLRVQN